MTGNRTRALRRCRPQAPPPIKQAPQVCVEPESLESHPTVGFELNVSRSLTGHEAGAAQAPPPSWRANSRHWRRSKSWINAKFFFIFYNKINLVVWGIRLFHV